MTLVDDLADVTLIDWDSRSILTDDANEKIASNMTLHVAPPSDQTNASGALWWLNFQQMHMAPPVD